MKVMKRMICFVLMMALAFSMSISPVSEAKKKVPKLNKKKVTITVGKTAKLKVKNTKKKVKWSIKSGKKKIKLTKKKKTSVVVSAKKAGKATVVAKVGKKKLNCKVTVVAKKTNNTTDNNKPDNKDNTNNSNVATAVKLASVTVVNPGTVQVTLTSAQQLAAKNFVVKKKELAHGTYNRTLSIESVVSTDNKTYTIKMDAITPEIHLNDYVQVTVSGLTGTGTATLETVYKKQLEYVENYLFKATAGTEIQENVYPLGYGSSVIVSQELPKGIQCQVRYDMKDYEIYELSGTIATAGKQTGKIVYKDEAENTYTVNITWLVGDENTMAAHCDATYKKWEKDTSTILETGIDVVGGSGQYDCTPVDAKNVYYDDTEEVIVGEFSAAGVYNITIEVEDVENPDIRTTCIWTVNVTEGKNVTINVKDAAGNVIKNDESLMIYATNTDTKNLYEDSRMSGSITGDGEYYVFVLEGVYDVELYLNGYQKKLYDVKVDKTTTSIDLTVDLLPVRLSHDTLDLSEAEWIDEDGYTIGYGDCLYVTKGSYEIVGRVINGDKIYDMSATFTYEGKELTVPVTASEKEFSVTTITRKSQIPLELETNYIYFTFIPEESGRYFFYSETEDATDMLEDTVGILLDKDKEELKENDDYNTEIGYEFGIEYDCEAGETYYIGIRANGESFAGLSSTLYVEKMDAVG